MEITQKRFAEIVAEAVELALHKAGVVVKEKREKCVLEMDATEFFSPERFDPQERRLYRMKIYNGMRNMQDPNYCECRNLPIIKTVWDLIKLPKQEFLRIPHFGHKTWKVVDRIIFHDTGYHLNK